MKLIQTFFFSLLIFSTSIVANASTASSFTGNKMQDNPFNLTTEEQLSANKASEIEAFWNDNIVISSFQGVDNKRVNTFSLITGNDNVIVISSGRTESALKYKELIFDLNQQGYDIFLIDHRGQGISERLGGDQSRGYVENFNDYVIDFNQFVTQLDLEKNYKHRYLISHSMGGAIAALYLEQYPHPFQATVFNSPMLEINLMGLPTKLVKFIVDLIDTVCNWFFDLPCYAPTQGAFADKHFKDNELTSSKVRFHFTHKTFIEHPESQLGGPTAHWISTSIDGAQKAIDNAANIHIPVFLMQATMDSVVNPQGQNAFYNNLNNCNANQFIKIEGAEHETFIEQDKYRLPALTQLLYFLKKQQEGELTCTK
ncbi:MAG TPA: alpha/beta fold hydrolase [Psychromonas hadalis]|nr:alpha/beta fold hydrolase [Psychromonas hadalis]